MSITEPTNQIVIFLDENFEETTEAKAKYARVFNLDENGDLEESETILLDPSIQEAQEWDESKHPRGEGGRWATTDGSQGFPKTTPAVGFKEQYEAYKQYDENPRGTGFEAINPTDQPTTSHLATAYSVLSKYPDMDEATMIQQSVRADHIRQMHISMNTQTQEQLQGALPFARVTGRVKSRKSMLDKLGRKRSQYGNVDQLGDVSASRVMTSNIVENEVAQEYVRQNFDIIKEDDKIINPDEGYRAIHFDIRNPDGTVSELQVRTANQDKWALQFHDTIYKRDSLPPDQRAIIEENLPQLLKYGQDMSDYYYQSDLGNVVPTPLCPPIVSQVLGGCL